MTHVVQGILVDPGFVTANHVVFPRSYKLPTHAMPHVHIGHSSEFSFKNFKNKSLATRASSESH